MSNNRRGHNHDSISPIKAIQVCSNVQNEILKIKKFKASPSNSKEYVNHLRDEIIKSMGTVFLFLINAENNKSVDVKIESLYAALTESGKVKLILTDISVKRITKRINSFKHYFDKTNMSDIEEYNFIMICIESLTSWKSHAVQGSKSRCYLSN